MRNFKSYISFFSAKGHSPSPDPTALGTGAPPPQTNLSWLSATRHTARFADNPDPPQRQTDVRQRYVRRFMDNSPTNKLADNQFADRPTRRQTNSLTHELADRQTRRQSNSPTIKLAKKNNSPKLKLSPTSM